MYKLLHSLVCLIEALIYFIEYYYSMIAYILLQLNTKIILNTKP
ncbi:hypothetical protein A1OE_172 [Candidatus Endolissoclinum faulkneri L2]|uniref:Uncharacterized protein n=1 Tax=Candidatus Endolissoclinum faulkneri L2 TaxID=1193729 RepID=K7YFL4_9PROT|nr:hypothetical protein A1OE_172 [Candidatus Endolissoclinum faulkneri L2]